MKYFFLVIILSLFSLFPLFHQGFFVTDDGDWMIVRFSAFHQAIRDGEFPVRFLGRLNQEYGYPVATFLYPGFMYLAEPLHLIGFGFVDSIKILLGASMFFSTVFCYLWLRRFFDEEAAFVGSLVYLYTPYHLYDIFQRGSVGEVLSLAIFPFILWQIERKSLFWSAIGIGMLLISHNILAAIFLLFLFCYLAVSIFLTKNKKFLLRNFGFMILFGFGVSAFFWIPALSELHYTVFSQTQISDWSKYFASVALVGFSTIVVLAVFIVSGMRSFDSLRSIRMTKIAIFFFVVALLSLFFATPMSAFFWEILPVQFIQFPFRVLSLLLVCLAFLAASSVSFFSGKQKIFIGIVFLFVLGLSAYPFAQIREYTNQEDSYYATNLATTTVHNEYMPVWVKQIPMQRAESKVQKVKGKGEISNIIYNNKEVNFVVDTKENMIVQVNTIYWPGWHALIDGKEAKIVYTNPQGVMQLIVPAGNHEVRVVFGETTLRILADLVSLVSLIILLFITWKNISDVKNKILKLQRKFKR